MFSSASILSCPSPVLSCSSRENADLTLIINSITAWTLFHPGTLAIVLPGTRKPQAGREHLNGYDPAWGDNFRRYLPNLKKDGRDSPRRLAND
jgi:hypothetical protein